jgi:3-dehydroquinate dehydratase
MPDLAMILTQKNSYSNNSLYPRTPRALIVGSARNIIRAREVSDSHLDIVVAQSTRRGCSIETEQASWNNSITPRRICGNGINPFGHVAQCIALFCSAISFYSLNVHANKVERERERFRRRSLTRAQIVTVKYCSQRAGGTGTRRNTEGNSNVVNALDVVLCLDDSVEAVTWADCGRDSDADYPRAGEGEEGCCDGCGGEMHFEAFLLDEIDVCVWEVDREVVSRKFWMRIVDDEMIWY